MRQRMPSNELATLVARAKTGDHSAWNELVTSFHPTLVNAALRHVGNYHDARAIAQDTWLTALRKLHMLVDNRAFAGWIMTTLRRLTINFVKRRDPSDPVPDLSWIGSGRTESPTDDLEAEERRQQLRDGLLRLRESDRSLLVEFYLEGHSLKELSDTLERPIGTIKRQLHTARGRLREELSHLMPA